MDKESIMEFSEPHAELFRDYVVYKRTLGYSIGYGYQAVLRDISRRLAALPQRACVIDKSAAERIAERREGESVSSQCKRITISRQFCTYLASRGIDAYVLPPNLVRDTTDFAPRIISEKEMAHAIDAADRTMQDWVGLLLRILWCCGLRINEALHLNVGDIVDATETLVVRNAKGDRMRLCPASPSLYSHIRSYMKRHGLECADESTPLIPSADGVGHRSHVTAAVKIKEAFAMAGVTRPEGGTPRPHDIRHSFAIRALERALDAGRDIYATLPVLATYMGHADIKSTEYYLRLTEDAHRKIIDAMEPVTETVFGGSS